MLRSNFRNVLLCSAAIAAIHNSPAFADTTVSDDSEEALATSSAGDVTIGEDVVLEVDGSDPLTLDSDNAITIEEGAYVIADDADGRNGILIESGTDGTLLNDGIITVLEDFVPEDEDANSRPDDAIAQATDRTGILVNATEGTIVNDEDGYIAVEGLNSAGIRFADGWSGSFDNIGSIYVVGDNSVGIATGDIDTDFLVGGTVKVVGEGAQALVVDGDVDGSLTIDGTLTKAYSYTNDDGDTFTLSRSQLRTSAAAVEITGSVTDGILVDAPPLDLDDENDDEDGDGIDDDDETTGYINSYGESPAFLIGGEDDISIGGGTTRDGTYSLGIDGTIYASGYYSGFDAVAVEIGGQGGTVDLTDGISIGGTVKATTQDSSAIGLLINEGANVPELYVSGSLSAVLSSTGEGSVVALQDLSGTLSLVENTGSITVTGAAEDETIALDLSGNTSGVTILQYLNDVDAESYAEELEDEDYDPADPTIYARITGDILTGSGDDLIDASTGIIKGDSYLGAGDDTIHLSGNSEYDGDIFAQSGLFTMTMANTSQFSGMLDVAGETASLTLADEAIFSGSTANSGLLSAYVEGGLLQAAEDGTITLDNLSVSSDGSIGIVVDADDGTNSTFAVNTASFEEGAGVDVEINDVLGAEGSYVVLTADEMSGQDGVTLVADDVPLIYDVQLSNDLNSITVEIAHKTAEDLGLNKAQTASYDAILSTAANDSYLEASILQAEDIEGLQTQFNEFLPDYAGGVFDFVTRSSRLATRRLSDDIGNYDEWQAGIWLEAIGFKAKNDDGETAAYDSSGWGISGGWERKLGEHYLGISGSYTMGGVDTGDYQAVDIGKYELAAHWRMHSENLAAFARLGFISASMDMATSFTGTVDDTDFTYDSSGDWSGHGYTGMIGGSYGFDVAESLTLRPKIVADYYRFKEKGYTTTSDSDALVLEVAGRTSDVTTVNTSLVASYQLQHRAARYQPMTFELEGGYRSVIAGKLGSVTASFEDGDSFTLSPASLKGGWNTEARLRAGGWDHVWLLAGGVEQVSGDFGFTARGTLNIAF